MFTILNNISQDNFFQAKVLLGANILGLERLSEEDCVEMLKQSMELLLYSNLYQDHSYRFKLVKEAGASLTFDLHKHPEVLWNMFFEINLGRITYAGCFGHLMWTLASFHQHPQATKAQRAKLLCCESRMDPYMDHIGFPEIESALLYWSLRLDLAKELIEGLSDELHKTSEKCTKRFHEIYLEVKNRMAQTHTEFKTPQDTYVYLKSEVLYVSQKCKALLFDNLYSLIEFNRQYAIEEQSKISDFCLGFKQDLDARQVKTLEENLAIPILTK